MNELLDFLFEEVAEYTDEECEAIDKVEVWKDIENYEGLYQVSNMGRVKSLNYNHTGEERILKQVRCGKYWQVHFCKNGGAKRILVHRLVAIAFIPNPHNLPFINHKDENPSNNRAENLEWCDYKYNNNYGTRNQRSSENRINHPLRSKKVLQFTKSGEFIKEYPSLAEVYRQTGIRQGNIYSCCSGREHHNTAGGFIWKYKE